jgi:hypothetical protein
MECQKVSQTIKKRTAEVSLLPCDSAVKGLGVWVSGRALV